MEGVSLSMLSDFEGDILLQSLRAHLNRAAAAGTSSHDLWIHWRQYVHACSLATCASLWDYDTHEERTNNVITVLGFLCEIQQHGHLNRVHPA